MAQIVEAPFELDLNELKSGIETDVLLLEPRSPGLHQSDLIRDLENTVLKPGLRKPDIDISDDEMATLNRYREAGFMWEIILESVFKRRRIDNLNPKKFLRQVEIQHDGVFKTIDALQLEDRKKGIPKRVLEFKLTFRSAGRAQLDRIESEFWSWFVQLKGNCLAWDTRIASLFVFFVNGNYKPTVPQTRRFDIAFTDEELLQNWSMLKQHEVIMRREGRIKEEKPRG